MSVLQVVVCFASRALGFLRTVPKLQPLLQGPLIDLGAPDGCDLRVCPQQLSSLAAHLLEHHQLCQKLHSAAEQPSTGSDPGAPLRGWVQRVVGHGDQSKLNCPLLQLHMHFLCFQMAMAPFPSALQGRICMAHVQQPSNETLYVVLMAAALPAWQACPWCGVTAQARVCSTRTARAGSRCHDLGLQSTKGKL